MIKKSLGSTDLSVSELCLGTMYFGTAVNEKMSFDLLNSFTKEGGNFIDTANNYCYWNGGSGDESELLIGKWLKNQKNRSQIVLASKIGARPVNSNKNLLEGLKKNTILQAVEDSLRRLNTDYLDICYIHADLLEFPLEERLEAFDLLEKQGKIRHKGTSNISIQRFTESKDKNQSKGYTPFQVIQQKFSYLLPENIDQNHVLKFADKDFIRLSEELEITFLTYSILLSGAYSRAWADFPIEYKSEKNYTLYKEMIAAARVLGCTNSQWVLRWVMNQSYQIIPLIAASSRQQLMENISALKFDLK